jgi:hypothetical protein
MATAHDGEPRQPSDAGHASWADVVIASLHRSRARFLAAGLANVHVVERLEEHARRLQIFRDGRCSWIRPAEGTNWRGRDPTAPAVLVLEAHSGRQLLGRYLLQCPSADGTPQRPTNNCAAYDAASHRSLDCPASHCSLGHPAGHRSLDYPPSHSSPDCPASHRSLDRRPPNASLIGHE